MTPAKHTYYHTCELCGANLDPGERCDCMKAPAKSQKKSRRNTSFIGYMGSIRKRLETAERKQERDPPLDIIGRYYDTLTQAEKRRFWKYVYGDSFTLEQAERIEEKHISGTLHFICDMKPGDYSFPELDEWEAALDKTLDNIKIP